MYIKKKIEELKNKKMASSTKNIKGNRKVVRVTLYAPQFIFKIPDGLDLEDETVVENWYSDGETMYIKYVGKEEEEEIEAYREFEVEQEIEIIDADDAGCEELNEDETDDEDKDEEDEDVKVKDGVLYPKQEQMN